MFKQGYAILLCLGLANVIFAQSRQYSFNNPGNACYIEYICFAPNNNYDETRRPYLFVLGNPEETAKNLYQNDKLKDLPQFYNYKFIYIPNKGESHARRLECINALVSLVTFNYNYGKNNLFFQVLDTSITSTDVETAKLYRGFKNVRLASQEMHSTEGLPSSVLDDFKENVSAYDVIEEDEEDKYGTFYEEEPTTSTEELAEKAKKVYFGPPTAFQYTLTGLVRDKATGEALPFATVAVRGLGIGLQLLKYLPIQVFWWFNMWGLTKQRFSLLRKCRKKIS